MRFFVTIKNNGLRDLVCSGEVEGKNLRIKDILFFDTLYVARDYNEDFALKSFDEIFQEVR